MTSAPQSCLPVRYCASIFMFRFCLSALRVLCGRESSVVPFNDYRLQHEYQDLGVSLSL
jgi:hypothetical protein